MRSFIAEQYPARVNRFNFYALIDQTERRIALQGYRSDRMVWRTTENSSSGRSRAWGDAPAVRRGSRSRSLSALTRGASTA